MDTNYLLELLVNSLTSRGIPQEDAEKVIATAHELGSQPVNRPMAGCNNTPPPINTSNKGVTLLEFGHQKIKVIKAIRQYTGLGLKEAKYAAENTPWTYINGNPAHLRDFRDALIGVGARVIYTK